MDASKALLDTVVGVVDGYLTTGLEDSAFFESAFRNTFNNDLNGFLKWEKLGKSESDTPCRRRLLEITKNAMGIGKSLPREMIAKVVAKPD